ncbi:hypothetical protein LIER_13826 [Lithospermum erythrorhizon]|uniref:Uncharacterized protein n=1 Tax=Lithospermum erythrorhizon TaxID=34254 RepID=A0AAV3PYH0_LITER
MIEWVAEEAFRTKEVMDNAPEGGGRSEPWYQTIMGGKTTLVSYPQTNRQVEVMNQIIFKGVKMRLQEERGSWDEELPMVLWSFRTTANPNTGETPYSLVYGSVSLLPVEIHLDTA